MTEPNCICMRKQFQSIIFFVVIFLSISGSNAQKAELIIQTGHQQGISKIVASPDGKYLLTCDNTLTTILWDINTRTQLRIIPGTVAVNFLNDSKSFLIVTAEGYKISMDINGKVIQKSQQKIDLLDVSHTGELYPDNNILLQDNTVINLTANTRKVFKMAESWRQHRRIGYSAQANIIALADQNDIELFSTLTSKKIKSISLAKMHGVSLHTVDFSADGKYILYGDAKQLQVFDIATGQSKTTILVEDFNEFFRAILSPDQQSIVAITKKKIIKYNLLTGKIVWSSILPPAFTSQSPLLYFTPDASKIIYFLERDHFFVDDKSGKISEGWSGRLNQYFTDDFVLGNESLDTKALSPQKKAAITWNFLSGTMKILPDYVEQYGRKIGIDTLNKISYFRQRDNLVGYDERHNKVTQIATASAGYSDLQLSGDGKYMFLPADKSDGNGMLNILKLPQGIVVNSLKGVADIATFAKANNWVASVNDISQSRIIIYEISSGKVIAQKKIISLEEGINSLQFSAKDNLIAYRVRAHNITIQSVKGDFVAVIPNAEIEGYSEFIFTKDEKYMIFTAKKNKGLLFYDIKKKAFVKEKAIDCPLQNALYMKMSADGRFLFVGSGEKNIQVFDLQKNKWVATLYSFVDTGDWAVITQDGRFDATPGAEKQLYFVKGIVTYPLETLYENCYTPKLLRRILAGESFPLVDNNIDNLHPRPKIKINYQEKSRNLEVEDDSKPAYNNTTGLAEITINASAENDKIDEIRLFHNGKIVNLATRGLFVTDDATSTDFKKYTINLMPGQNSFRAIALNTQRTESKPDEIIVNYQTGNQPVNAPPKTTTTGVAIDKVDKNATLHLIVVGINQYQNKSMVLNYALADATAFKDELEKDAKSIIANIKTYFVTDNAATKTGITNAFKQVQETAKPQDVFVFYYAGHGVIGKDKEFYLVPNDVSDLKNAQAELESKGMPAKLMQKYAIDIPAQKQLFILDACQSAGAFNEMLSADGDQQKSIAVVSRSTGTHWMAASGAQQYANEFSQLGHGAFTYVLLEALKGSAAADKMITVNGLKNYLQQEVPELMKKYSGTLQYPASYGFGNDFPVEIVK